jgi:peptidyl-prolyl cis-trans isomerase C
VKKTISTIIALTLVASIGVAQEKPAAPAAAATTATAAQADPIVIAAGDLAIRKSEFESALSTLPAEYAQYAAGPGKRQFAEDYLRMKMLAREGTKAGLDKDADVIRQLNLMRENLIAQAQLERIEKGITVSDADLKKQYDAQKAQYEQVKARHILIAFKGSPAANAEKPELTEEQAKAKAEELRTKIVGGASFEELAQKESDDLGSGSRGGDLGEFGRGQMVPEFEKAAFEAKVGEVTPVVRTQFGYHIIKIDSHGTTSFDEVKPTLERTARQTAMQAKLEEMKTNSKATFNDEYFGAAAPAPQAQTPPAGEGDDGHKH